MAALASINRIWRDPFLHFTNVILLLNKMYKNFPVKLLFKFSTIKCSLYRFRFRNFWSIWNSESSHFFFFCSLCFLFSFIILYLNLKHDYLWMWYINRKHDPFQHELNDWNAHKTKHNAQNTLTHKMLWGIFFEATTYENTIVSRKKEEENV